MWPSVELISRAMPRHRSRWSHPCAMTERIASVRRTASLSLKCSRRSASKTKITISKLWGISLEQAKSKTSKISGKWMMRIMKSLCNPQVPRSIPPNRRSSLFQHSTSTKCTNKLAQRFKNRRSSKRKRPCMKVL